MAILLIPPLTQSRLPTSSYASALINPPAHANPRVAAREGIKARQFLIQGLKKSKFSHLDSFQLKTELNKILPKLGLPTGKIQSVINSIGGGTVIKADSDEAAKVLAEEQREPRYAMQKTGGQSRVPKQKLQHDCLQCPTSH